MGRCFGRTKTLRRCRREGNWRFFCPDHFWPSVVFLGTVFLAFVSLVANVYTVRRIWRSPSKEDIELRSEVYLHIDMACHEWKNAYIYLHPDLMKETEREREYTNIWEVLENEPAPPYTREVYLRFKPLFEYQANLLRKNIDNLLTSNSDILPAQFRTLMMKTMMNIETEQRAYRLTTMEFIEDKDSFFGNRFHTMVRYIAELSYAADRHRNEE